MATRAIFTFRDERDTFHVYKHWDGYPKEAFKLIRKTLQWAWKLPRFEADEFACAFISANKPEAGDIRLAHTNVDPNVDFRYEISCIDGELFIICYGSCYNEDYDKELFAGSMTEFKDFVNKDVEGK